MLATITVTLMAASAVATAVGARVRTIHCTNYYSLIQPRSEIFRLTITQAKRLVDGYAPRCLVAASVAQSVVNDQAHFFSPKPRVYLVHGARWNAGYWQCTRRFVTHFNGVFDETDGLVTCRHTHDYGSKANTLVSTVRFGYHTGS
ncbi:MAG: hypothetical protein ACYC91_17885 [Solirubrobacteraceae bacterium]